MGIKRYFNFLAAGFVFFIWMINPASAAGDFFITPGQDAQEKLQEALILAEPGQTVELAAGIFELTDGLSIDVANLTLIGQGMNKSILSFKSQQGGSEGLLITSDQVVLKDFAVEDAKGDAIKTKGVDGIAMIRVRAEWTGGPKST
ncbi:MAG: hypothetical protein ABJP25_01365, partial [Sneathiella sp.]